MNQKNMKKMPFWDHVQEFRNRILYVLISVAVFSILGYLFYEFFFGAIAEVIQEELYATHITEGFTTRLRVSFLLGVFISIPFLFFQLLQFIFPALEKKSKIIVFIILVCSFSLFIIGILFGYKSVLPVSMQFLKSREFFPETVLRLISYDKFILFFFQFLIAFGICFQFPIALIILLHMEIVTVKTLIRFSKYFILGFFTISAIITPPDIISQLLLTLPLIILYALSIAIGVVFRIGKS